MSRAPPPPTKGWPMATSGVAVVGRKPCPTARQTPAPPAQPLLLGSGCTELLYSRLAKKAGKMGLLKLGWLKRLKKSARNSIVKFSRSLVSFEMEKSKLR